MITVIIVNWNGWQDTIAAYESLEKSEYQDWKLIVVDNASTDDSRARLAEMGPRAKLIANKKNAGFAGGCNIGIRDALAEGADFIFLLNSDATVKPDTLATLVHAHASVGEAVFGCVVRYKETDEFQFFGSRTSLGTGAPDWFKLPADLAELQKPLIATDFIFGAALFAPSELFHRIGFLDERFFLTFEETDWCYRARALGILCLVVRDAVVEHVGSASMGSATSPLQAYFLQRNRLLFYEMHASRRILLRGLKVAILRISHGLWREMLGGSINPTRRALIIAVRDYILRRFGDCPTTVRRLRSTSKY